MNCILRGKTSQKKKKANIKRCKKFYKNKIEWVNVYMDDGWWMPIGFYK